MSKKSEWQLSIAGTWTKESGDCFLVVVPYNWEKWGAYVMRPDGGMNNFKWVKSESEGKNYLEGLVL